MLRRVLAVVVLVTCAFVLGATVFHEQVASAAQAILPVFVTNDVANAVPVHDADNPAVQPVTLRVQRSFPNETNSFLEDLYTVPANKRLVVEYVHANLTLPLGDQARCTVTLGTTLLDVPLVHLRTIDLVQVPPVEWGADIPVRLYSDAGDDVKVHCSDAQVLVQRNATVLISGHLVNVG